jgi:hypothetical protein
MLKIGFLWQSWDFLILSAWCNKTATTIHVKWGILASNTVYPPFLAYWCLLSLLNQIGCRKIGRWVNWRIINYGY